MSERCQQVVPYLRGRIFRGCDHLEEEHDEDGCLMCDCGGFTGDEEISGFEERPRMGGEDPVYRHRMNDAGRGAQA